MGLQIIRRANKEEPAPAQPQQLADSPPPILASEPQSIRRFALNQDGNPCLEVNVKIYSQQAFSLAVAIKQYPAEMAQRGVVLALSRAIQRLVEAKTVAALAFRFLSQIKQWIEHLVAAQAVPPFELAGFSQGSGQYLLYLMVDRTLLQAFLLPPVLLRGYALLSGQPYENCRFPLSLGVQVQAGQPQTLRLEPIAIITDPAQPESFLTIRFDDPSLPPIVLALEELPAGQA